MAWKTLFEFKLGRHQIALCCSNKVYLSLDIVTDMWSMRSLNFNKKFESWWQYLFKFRHESDWYDGEINDYYFGPFSYHVWK